MVVMWDFLQRDETCLLSDGLGSPGWLQREPHISMCKLGLPQTHSTDNAGLCLGRLIGGDLWPISPWR